MESLKIIVEHHFIFPREFTAGVTSKLDLILTRLQEIQMTQVDLDAAMTKMEAELEVEGDAVVAIENFTDFISAQLAAALEGANGADPALVARMTAVETKLRERKEAIAAKILANQK